jgi:hypothetical protein
MTCRAPNMRPGKPRIPARPPGAGYCAGGIGGRGRFSASTLITQLRRGVTREEQPFDEGLGNGSYQADEIQLDPEFAADDYAVLREYAHHVLLTVQGSPLWNPEIGYAGLESGLAATSLRATTTIRASARHLPPD